MGKRACLLFVTAIILLITIALPATAGGHWVLAFWRSLGKGDNSNQLFIRVWTFDENGNKKGNVRITTVDSTLLMTTSADGRVDMPMSVSEEYRCRVDANSGATSEISPYMSNGRYPEWGHYSYELGFMYKSDVSNSGDFDSTMVGGSVPRRSSNTDNAPCTASMAYYSFDPSDWDSDVDGSGSTYALGSTGEHGQTFIANGNRVACAEFHPTVGGNNTDITFTVEIRDGGPNGAVIASKTSSMHKNQDWWVVPFGTSACPVIPGHTYFARVYGANMAQNAYYASKQFGGSLATGTAYARANSSSSWAATSYPCIDLKGFIVCCNAFDDVTITNANAAPGTGSATITWTTDVNASSRIDYGTTLAYGKSISDSSLIKNHSMTITGLHGATVYYYKITSAAANHNDGIVSGSTFTTVPAVPSFLVNGGFESGQLDPWVKFGSFSNSSRADGIGQNCLDKCPVEGTYDIVSIANNDTNNGGVYQRVNGVKPGSNYTLRAGYYTKQIDGLNSDVVSQIGIDPFGGTDPGSANVKWSSALTSQDIWSTALLSAVAQNSSITVFLKAIQNNAISSSVNAFDDVKLLGPYGISGAKGFPDGCMVSLAGKIVTATANQFGAYYIEEPDRASGIRVENTSGSASVDNLATVSGCLKTINGERVIFDATVSSTGSSQAKPLAVSNKALGGKDFNASALGETDSSGVNNVGLLIRTYGKVTSKNGTDFYITDGSDSPIRVDAAAVGTLPNVDDFVIVTGICRLQKSGSNYIPYVQLRTTGDWRKVN